jgi:hypothetical protein
MIRRSRDFVPINGHVGEQLTLVLRPDQDEIFGLSFL